MGPQKFAAVLHRREFLTSGASAVAFATLERRSGRRLGVYARDAADDRGVAYRADERFPLRSTFKALLAGAVLQRVDRGVERFERRIAYGKADLLDYAPVTRAHVREGALSVAALCEAAVTVSDNTAANLLLRTIGGPAGLTAFVRAAPFHDDVTRLDRTEPALNAAIPGDPRDTSSPRRMAEALRLLLVTPAVLSETTARRLEGWLRACKTGTSALRAGAPAGWIAGDKTGSGANATRNDIAIFRRPGRAPLFVAAYLTGAHALDDAGRNAVLADAARVVSTLLG